MLPVSDDGRVQVAVTVNLGAANEAQVHLACSQQTHHVQGACSPDCPGNIWSVTHRIEQLLRRLITHNTNLEKPYTGGRVGTLRQGKRNQWEAHAYKDIFAIASLPRRTGNHQFPGCVIHGVPIFPNALLLTLTAYSGSLFLAQMGSEDSEPALFDAPLSGYCK